LRICAGGILVRGQDILLAKRSADRPFYPGVWDVVGGHCETNEAPADALIRELREEIGVEALAVEQIAIFGDPEPATHGEARYHMFVVTAWSGEPELRNAEHSELRWVGATEAGTLPLAHPDYPGLFREAIRRAQAAGADT
jgi:8-oxo-dGTP diphosphatase